MENKPEQTLEVVITRFINDRGISFSVPDLAAAIRAAGYVQLSKNQEAPINEMCGAPNDDWEQAQKVMLTPDANGEAFRRVRVREPRPVISAGEGQAYMESVCHKCPDYETAKCDGIDWCLPRDRAHKKWPIPQEVKPNA